MFWYRVLCSVFCVLCLKCFYDGQNREQRGHSGVGTSKSYRCPIQQRAGKAGREDTDWTGKTEFCQFWWPAGPCRSALSAGWEAKPPPDRFCLFCVHSTEHWPTLHYTTLLLYTTLASTAVQQTTSFCVFCSQNLSDV